MMIEYKSREEENNLLTYWPRKDRYNSNPERFQHCGRGIKKNRLFLSNWLNQEHKRKLLWDHRRKLEAGPKQKYPATTSGSYWLKPKFRHINTQLRITILANRHIARKQTGMGASIWPQSHSCRKRCRRNALLRVPTTHQTPWREATLRTIP